MHMSIDNFVVDHLSKNSVLGIIIASPCSRMYSTVPHMYDGLKDAWKGIVVYRTSYRSMSVGCIDFKCHEESRRRMKMLRRPRNQYPTISCTKESRRRLLSTFVRWDGGDSHQRKGDEVGFCRCLTYIYCMHSVVQYITFSVDGPN